MLEYKFFSLHSCFGGNSSVCTGGMFWASCAVIFGASDRVCQIRYHSHCGIIVALDSSEP